MQSTWGRGQKAKAKDDRIEVQNIPWRMGSGWNEKKKKMQFYKPAIHSVTIFSNFYVPGIVLGQGML